MRSKHLLKRSLFLLISSILITLALISSPQLYAAEDPYKLPPDALSASHSEGAFAPLVNPAYADLSSRSYLAYRFVKYDSKDANHFFMLNLLGFSLNYAWYNHAYRNESGTVDSINGSYFNISKGFMYKETFGFGVSYSWANSDNSLYDGYNSWTLGFLLRPFSILSLGISLRDLGADINNLDIKRSEVYSVSLRPITNRVTLTMDIHREAGQNFKNAAYLFSAEGRVFYDISLFCQTDTNYNLLFGVRMPFFMGSTIGSTPVIDTYRTVDKDSNTNYTSFAVSYPVEQYNSGIPLSKLFSMSGKTMLNIRLNRKIKEVEPDYFFSKKQLAFNEIVFAIQRAGKDDTIDGIILQIDRAAPGFGQLQELREELRRFKKAGKKVYSILTSPGNKEYYLATISDKIYFAPLSPFGLTALKAEVYFFKGLLDKVGVKFEAITHGKFKSYPEGFTREHMSENFRENITTLLTDLNKQYLDGITEDRGVKQSELDKLFEQGIMTPEEAKKSGFIDSIAYQDEALKDISEDLTTVQISQYMDVREKDFTWGSKPAIAIVYVTGSIIRGKSSTGFMQSSTGDESYKKMLKAAFTDGSIRAIIIRVSSGGGSATASDLMWNYLVKMKKKYKKPVVFSFGNVAASGGYYLACSGDRIFANKGSVTGSIGVFSGKLSLKELYAKLGINKDVIKMSTFADIFSESKDLEPGERKVLQAGVDFIYDRFTGKVMYGRKIKKGEIPTVAEGRVFTGNQAREKKLVDEFGGLAAALEYAKQLARVSDRCDIKIFPNEMKLYPSVTDYTEIKLLAEYVKLLSKNLALIDLKDERALYLYPYTIEIK
ncbi:MAG: signal peptide peptidase SppA [bacterium]|nr:signal peptide peptidase SppA [bacterium]